MSMQFVKKIPTADEIFNLLPLPEDIRKIKQARDEEIKAVFENRDPRFLLIIGPCSADSEESVCEYIERLAKVQEKVSGKIIMIPRIYTNKPRTTGRATRAWCTSPTGKDRPL